MSTHTAPTLAKIDVLEAAKSVVMGAPKVVASLGDAVLAINAGNGDFDWQLDDKDVEYHYCLRGTTHYELKRGDQALPPIDVKAGELLTMPAGVAHRGTCSGDNVVLVMQSIKEWQV